MEESIDFFTFFLHYCRLLGCSSTLIEEMTVKMIRKYVEEVLINIFQLYIPFLFALIVFGVVLRTLGNFPEISIAPRISWVVWGPSGKVPSVQDWSEILHNKFACTEMRQGSVRCKSVIDFTSQARSRKMEKMNDNSLDKRQSENL